MERWKLYALGAALFAGLTSVVAKPGLKTLGADVGLTLRTVFVLVFVIVITLSSAGWSKTASAVQSIDQRSLFLLAFSALCTTLSWVCYYRAMEEGTVSYVSLIDKSSILVTLFFSVLLLGESLTWRTAAGAALILGGMLVLAGKK